MKKITLLDEELVEAQKKFKKINDQLLSSKIRLTEYLESFFEEKTSVSLSNNSIEILLPNFNSKIVIKFSISVYTLYYKEIKLISEEFENFNYSIQIGIMFGNFIKNFCNISFLLEKKILALSILNKRTELINKSIQKIKEKIVQVLFEQNVFELIEHIEECVFVPNNSKALTDDLFEFVKDILVENWEEIKIRGLMQKNRKTADLTIISENETIKKRITVDEALFILGSGMLTKKQYKLDYEHTI